MNQKGSFAFFYAFIILSVSLLVLFALGLPLITLILTNLYEAGEPLLQDQNTIANSIDNNAIRIAMQDNIESQINGIPDQIDILTVFYQYGWLIILIIIAVTLFIYARQTVETGIG